MEHEFFASASSGTERALHDELKELGLKRVRFQQGGIPFAGDWQDAWTACLHSRIALRVMVLLGRFAAPSRDALYEAICGLDWAHHVTPRQTIAVSSVCNGSVFRHSGMAALVVKDAVVDRIRVELGDRPSVDREDPDVRIFLHLAGQKGAVYLDLAGATLSQRGYRTASGEAPLRETLAAAILRMAGWDRVTPLIDPMCGSGTIAIEAAMWAGNVAPGLLRDRFGFERWASFDELDGPQVMRRLRGDAHRGRRDAPVRVIAADVDDGMLSVARANARRAGVKLSFKQRGIGNWEFDGERRFVIMNPPYDERLEANTRFCTMVTAALSRMHGSRVAMISGLPEYRRVMSLAPAMAAPLKNGPLDCELLVYEVP